MDKTIIRSKTRECLADQLSLDQKRINDTDNLCDQLGMDSLDCVEFTMALEDEFQIEIPDEDTTDVHTVQDAIDLVIKKLGENK